MLDGNVLLRQKRDEVLKGTLSCPYRNMAANNEYGHRTGLCLPPSLGDSVLIQRTLSKKGKGVGFIRLAAGVATSCGGRGNILHRTWQILAAAAARPCLWASYCFSRPQIYKINKQNASFFLILLLRNNK